MKQLELLIPPPFIMLLVGLLMWWVSIQFPQLSFSWLHSIAAAISFSVLGAGLGLAGVITFRRASTTIDPKHPEETALLVKSGIYRYSRNPMYAGVLLLLFGWGVYLGNFLSIICTVLFVAYITRFQILPEERKLQDKFGKEFLAYKNKVGRWL